MPVQLEMRIGGGYAFVHNRAQDRFDVASIIPTEARHGNHRLTVRVRGAATVVPEAPDLLQQQPPVKGWDLTARTARLEIWPGGNIPKGVITPPDNDDRAYLPDVPELGRSSISPEWLTKISGRLTLRSGRLDVDRIKLATGAFEFRHPTRPPKPRLRLAHGVTGLIYRLVDNSPAVDSITLALFPRATSDHDIISGTVNPRPEDTFVITPGPGTLVTLQVDSLEPPKNMQNGMDLEEFAIFYRLLNPEPGISDQYIPRWFHGEGTPDSPGSECPPGIYDDPNG